MKILLFSAFLLIATLSFGQNQDKYEPFKASDYPKENYQITSDTVKFKDLIIEVKQVRSRLGNGSFSCRAWLTVSKGSKSVYQRFFKSIDAVGSCYGLFLPHEQPREDYFILSKLGDYDGRIFIIDSKGTVTEKLGGVFYISKDTRYLFSDYYSDLSGLTVFDFTTGQTLFSDTITPRLTGWYFKDNKYINKADLANDQQKEEKYYYFDLNTRKLVSFKQNKGYLKPEEELGCYNDKNNRRFCNCGLELQPE